MLMDRATVPPSTTFRVAMIDTDLPRRSGRGADDRSMHKLLARIAAIFLLALPLFAAAVGSTHRYTYDAVGNIVAIKNVAADALAFTSFSPTKAKFLAQVTLSGSGFSLVTTENVVSFNGTLANVVSATANTLVVTVPTNARTGRITVSVGSAFITNPTIFVVDTSLQAPTITSFSPAIVTPVTVVTIHGTNYDPVASNDAVTFNSTPILPSVLNATQMTGVVSAALSSGKITVSTVFGTAVSATDLIVLPYGYSASAIGTTPRTTIGGTPASVSIPIGKVGLVLFDAVQGENVSLGITNLVTSPANTGLDAVLITPTGATVQIGQHCGGSGAVGIFPPSSSCYLSTLSSTGTYTLLFSSASTTATTFKVSLTKEITSPLTTASQSVALSRAAQSERLTFIQNEGSTFTVEVAGITVTPATATLYGTLYDPDGNAIQTIGTLAGGLVFHVPHARIHGTYTVFLQADSGATVSARAMLDAGVNLPIDGATATINTTLTGKPAKYTFTATAGQSLGLALGGLTLTPTSFTNAGVVLLNPDGSKNSSISAYSYSNESCQSLTLAPNGCSWNLTNLPQTGTYTLLFIPGSSGVPTRSEASLMNATVTLSSDISGTLSAGSAPLTVNLTRPGQKERLSFPVIAGRPTGIQVGGVVTSGPTGRGITASIRDPNNTVVQSADSFGDFATGGVVLYMHSPSLSGTYTLYLEPDGAATGSAVVTLGGTSLVADGAPATISTTNPGLAVQYNFAGTQGQNLGLAVSGLTLNPTTFTVAGIALYNPDGTANSNINTQTNNYICASIASNPTGCGWDLPNLPQTGNYTLFVIPGFTYSAPTRVDAAAMNATVTLSTDASPPLAANTPLPMTLRAGKNERLSINATAGQPIAVEIAGIATSPSSAGMTATMFDPGGSYVQSVNSNTVNNPGGLLLYVANPSVSGTYTAVIGSNNGASGSATVTLDNGTALSINTPATLTTTVVGQSTRFNFSIGTAGQNVTVALAGLSMGPFVPNTGGSAAAVLFNPDGTRNGAINGCYLLLGATTSCAWNFNNLAAGTYTLIVMPGGYQAVPAVTDGLTMSATVTVSGQISSTLSSGVPLPLNLASAGQSERLSVNATAGQPMVIEIAGISTSPSAAGMTATLYDPAGTYVQALNSNTFNNPGGLLLYVANPSTSGAYSVVIQPNNGATGSAIATLDAGVPLPVNGPASAITTTAIGQSARFNFSIATSGQNVTLALTGLTMGPVVPNTDGTVSVALFNADGTRNGEIDNCYVLLGASTNCAWNFTNLAAGTYSLIVIPGACAAVPSVTDGLTMSTAVSVSTEVAATLTAGTPVSINLAGPGQSARLSFTGTAGMPIAVEVAGVTPTPASEVLSASLLGPTGSRVVFPIYSSSGGVLLYIPSAATTGTYALFAQFNDAATGSAQVTLDAGTTLPTNGTAVNFSTTVAGQSRVYQFGGTAAQNLTLTLSSLSMAPAGGYASVIVYSPTGAQINYAEPIAYSGGNGQLTLSNLPATGNYTVLLFPGNQPPIATAFTMSGSLSLH